MGTQIIKLNEDGKLALFEEWKQGTGILKHQL